MKMISEEVYHNYGNLFDFYCFINLKKNEAYIWREAEIKRFMRENGDQLEIEVQRDFENYTLVYRNKRFYLRNSEGWEIEQISRQQAIELAITTILNQLGKDFYFDGKLDRVVVDEEQNLLIAIEEPRTITLFDDENRFYIDPPYNTSWIEKREDGYYLCNKYLHEGVETSVPQLHICKALFSDLWKKQIFKFPDRE